MAAQVIETRRQPPLWGVKHRKRFRAVFHGADAKARAEAYAAQEYGEYEVLAKAPTGKMLRREAVLAAAAE